MNLKQEKKFTIDYKALGNRIREIRIARNQSQSEFALSFGLNQGDISEYERGDVRPPLEFLCALSEETSTSLEWLLIGQGSQNACKPGARVVIPDEFELVPRVNGSIEAGQGKIVQNDIDVLVAFRRDWIRKKGDPRRMSLINVTGDSMAPTLLAGDVVLVDHARNYVDPWGGIYAVNINDVVIVKRVQLQHKTGMLRIISDNTRYESFDIEPDRVRINGRVIWFARELD